MPQNSKTKKASRATIMQAARLLIYIAALGILVAGWFIWAFLPSAKPLAVPASLLLVQLMLIIRYNNLSKRSQEAVAAYSLLIIFLSYFCCSVLLWLHTQPIL